jgi:hypothetical protein
MLARELDRRAVEATISTNLLAAPTRFLAHFFSSLLGVRIIPETPTNNNKR